MCGTTKRWSKRSESSTGWEEVHKSGLEVFRPADDQPSRFSPNGQAAAGVSC